MAMELAPSLPVYHATCCSGYRASRSSLSVAMANPPSAALAENNDKPSSSSSSSSSGIPKMEPFNRSRVSRLVKEPSLLEKAEHAISDRCSVLEGDEAYTCWEALFEFENMKGELTGQCNVAPTSDRATACRPLERLENFVRQSGGVASLINNVRVLAKAKEMRKSSEEGAASQENTPASRESTHDADLNDENVHFFLEPGSLPPSEEELEMQRGAMMPDSPFTRLLRAVGVRSPWFSQPPDHETD